MIARSAVAAIGMVVALLLGAPAVVASEQRPTLSELEPELVCPTCKSTLDMSTAPVADRMRAFIRARIAAGDTESEIKAKLVAQFGPGVLSEPPREGFDLLAWLLPLAGAVLGATLVGGAAWRWARRRAEVSAPAVDPSSNGAAPLDPALERRLDDALARFDA